MATARLRLTTALPLLACLLLLLLGACRTPSETVRRSRILMDTVVEITATGPPEETAAAVDRAFAEMARIERLMSAHLSGSEIAMVSAARAPVEVSAEVAELVRLGLQVQRQSNGAFDMGMGRIKALWGLENGLTQVPDEQAIAVALAGVGPGDLRLDGSRLTKGDPDLVLDLGGIAKGYAIDRGAAILAAAPLSRATVNAGGDMRLIGQPEHRLWRIGIQHPRKPGILATLEVAGGAVVSSGDYERYVELDGVRYHHLLDPRSGFPARGCQSVTVLAPSAALADALATASFVLGPQDGLKLLQALPDVEGMLVTAEGEVLFTPGLQEHIRWP